VFAHCTVAVGRGQPDIDVLTCGVRERLAQPKEEALDTRCLLDDVVDHA
jgi:hypothetical protein